MYILYLWCTYLILLTKRQIMDWSKLKAFADDKINVTQTLELGSDRIENIVGKGENAGYQHFLLFPQCFQMNRVLGWLKPVVVS